MNHPSSSKERAQSFFALSKSDEDARNKPGQEYGTRKKPGRKKKPGVKHRTSFAFLEDDWALIQEVAYRERTTATDALLLAVRHYAKHRHSDLMED